jgi:hypothetical protein
LAASQGHMSEPFTATAKFGSIILRKDACTNKEPDVHLT